MQEFVPFRLLDRKAAENKGPGCEAESLMCRFAAAAHQLNNVRLTKLPAGDDQLRMDMLQSGPRALESVGAFRYKRGPHDPIPVPREVPTPRRIRVLRLVVELHGKEGK